MYSMSSWTFSGVTMSRQSLLAAAAALSMSFGMSAIAHAQATISLPTSCVPLLDQQVNVGGQFIAATGLIQNFGQSILVVNCSIARPAVGQNTNGTVTIDALTQPAGPALTARLMAAASPPGGGTTFMFVNLSTTVGVTGFQRVTSAQFPMPINDDFRVFLRVVLNRFDILGRILYRQDGPI